MYVTIIYRARININKLKSLIYLLYCEFKKEEKHKSVRVPRTAHTQQNNKFNSSGCF